MEPVVVLILSAVFVGAVSQRVTGMGFGLVSGPFLVLLLDPFTGIILVNICGIAAAGTVFLRTWREIDPKILWRLAVATILGTVPGALLAATLEAPPLQIVIGVLIIVSLLSSLIIGRVGRTMPENFGTQFAFGFLSGTMSAASGTGGPAISAYAVLTRWDQRTFAATLQPFLVIGTTSALVFKALFDRGAWPQLELTVWVGIGVLLLAGMLCGELLSKKVEVRIARRAMIVLALGGGAATLVKGLTHLG